jgi:outer membrane protein
MSRKIGIAISFLLILVASLKAQNNQIIGLTLDECIAIALDKNLDLKSIKLSAKTSEVYYNQSRSDMIPSLNANFNLGLNNGRSIDPFTNGFIDQELTFSNAGLSLNATLFDGLRIMNSIKRDRFNLLASEMDIEENKQNLVLEVTLRYIQILNNIDALELAKSRLETTKVQLKRLEVHYIQQIGNPVDYTDMLGQSTIDESEIIIAHNNLKTAILDLAKLLNLDLDTNSDFQNILGLVGSEKYPYSADDVFEQSLQNLATFKSKEYRIDAADTGVKVAKSNFYPEISLFGQLNTNYSSLANLYTATGSQIVETGDFVDISNQEFPVLRNETQFESVTIDYNDQFNNNLNSVVGISMRIPILNSFRARNNVKIQKIELDQSVIELENTKLLFKQSIEQAYNNMESSYNRYFIQLQQVDAYNESFRVNEVRFENGVSNIVDYITSKNNMDIAQLNLNKNKYEYLLRVKILEYYRGL